MKMKLLVPLIIVLSIALSGVVFGQTTTATGKVLALSSTSVTLDTGTGGVWDIKRTKTTTVNGTLKVGSMVTVTYSVADGQKREGGVSTNPTATPAGE